ncbi:MAG: PKD domain-containing protein, partial [Thermoplasmatota archaeon]
STGIVQGTDRVGGLVGENKNSSVYDSYSTASVVGDEDVGGLIGYHHLGSVSGSHASGRVIGKDRVGGLVGNNEGSSVHNSYSDGNVSGGDLDVGGLIGLNDFSGLVFNSHYNIDEVSIRGGHQVSYGGLFDSQYKDWLTNNMELDISNYADTLVLSGDHYMISSVDGLKDLLGFADRKGYHFHLGSDIDLSNDTGLHVPFFGCDEFDGNGYVISNLRIDGPSTYVGLFGYNAGGAISSLNLIDISVNGISHVGGLIGYNSGGFVSNSSVYGTVTGMSCTGGVVGSNVGGCVSCSYSLGTVNGGIKIGGGVGRNTGTVSVSHSIASVNGNSYVGGLVGSNDGGLVSRSYSTGHVKGLDHIGGLVGSSSGTVEDSFWDMNTSGQATSAGGMGKITEEMKMKRTFTMSGWDFVNVWEMEEGITYPLLWFHLFGPSADAGSDIEVDEGELVTFDGSSSTGFLARYSWTFIYGTIETTLSGSVRSYEFNIPGNYIVTLTVSDVMGFRDVDTLNLTVKDITPPIADAGLDMFVDEGELVTFNGKASMDNIGVVNYTWTFHDRSAITLYGLFPSYRFNTPGVYVVTLNVTDAAGIWDTDTVTVTVKDITPPTALTGSDHIYEMGTTVMLNGSASWDNVGIVNYTWNFNDGVDGIILYGDMVFHQFNIIGIHVIELTVEDAAGHTDCDMITLTIIDTTPPFANAGSDMTVAVGSTVILDGSLSSDNDVIVDHIWAFHYGGIEEFLKGEVVSFVFDVGGTYEILLTVIDRSNNIGNDTVTITVIDTGTVIAVVVDVNGIPVDGADVEIIASDGTVSSAVTGVDGMFSIDIYHGEFNWTISRNGYMPISGTSHVAAMEEIELDLSDTPLVRKEDTKSFVWFFITLISVLFFMIGVSVVFIFTKRRRERKLPEAVMVKQFPDNELPAEVSSFINSESHQNGLGEVENE